MSKEPTTVKNALPHSQCDQGRRDKGGDDRSRHAPSLLRGWTSTMSALQLTKELPAA